jgi:hypothetical protein
MLKEQLGRLERVTLRDIWESESGDFTPWLASETNLKLLGDTIGIELELEAQEKDVGQFRADILCKDTSNGSWVLIENQLETTDHTHLGQILTYAAGLDAVSIVWIAERFTDEHKATIAWLNEIASEKINFFALEVEVWKIGNSASAPKFNVVAMPNEWTKGGAGAGRIQQADLSETKQLQLDYWREFRAFVVKKGSPMKPTKPLPQHWMNFAIGTSRAYPYAFVNTQENRIGVRLGLCEPERLAIFHLLLNDKDAIEKEIGEPLVWDELPDKKTSYISVYKSNVNPRQREDWATQHGFVLGVLEKFRKVFAQRIKNLGPADYQTFASTTPSIPQ